MDQNKGLSAIGYLSFYFMPFILPIIIFFVAKDEYVKYHNKRAAISQAIPFVLGILYLIAFLFLTFSDSFGANYGLEISLFIAFTLLIIISVIIAIWSIVQAIKALR